MQACSDFKDLKLLPDGDDDDDICDGLNIEDVQLNFESDDEIFGCSHGQSSYQIRDVEKSLSVGESDSPIPNALEVCCLV